MTTSTDHEAYIAAAPHQLRSSLENLRKQLAKALPDADEVIAYKMPGFKSGDSIVAGYAAFSKQCGLYVSPVAISSLADEIRAAGFKATKTGVTFSPENPLPAELISKLARASKKHSTA